MRLAIVIAALLLTGATAARGQDANTRARAASQRAQELAAQGNDQAALSLLWEAAGLAPHDADVQNRLGEALERLGALDAAIDAFRIAAAERPQFDKAANNLLLGLVKAGRGPEAVALARARLAAAPEDPERMFTLGLAQSEQDVEAAETSFRRVLARAPRHTLARYNLALILQRIDRLNDALAELDAGIAIEPRPELYYSPGRIDWHQGQLDRAAAALQQAVTLQPTYFDGYHTLGAVLSARQDWPGAAAALRRAIALRADAPAPQYALAQVLQRQGHESEARAVRAGADRLRERAAVEQEAGILTAAGTQKLDAGEALPALDCFRRAVALLDTYAPAHYQMGRALTSLGDREGARASFARAHALNPSLIPARDPRWP
jgi:tetratricopeptide (TPR) repeat protein